MAKTYQATVGESPQAIERQRAMAQLLGQGAMTQEGTQMVSGHVVPYSPIQGLTKLAQALLANRINEKADAKEEAARQAQQAKVMGWVQDFVGLDKPESIETVPGDFSDDPMKYTAPAVQASKQVKMAKLLEGMASPGTAGIAAPFLAQMMKPQEGFTLGKDQVRFEGGQQVAAGPKGADEVKAPTTRQVQMGKEVVSQEWNPTTKTWTEVGRGEKGPLATVSVENVTKGEGEQLKEMQKEMGGYRVQIQKAGVEAPRQLARLDRMEKLLEGVEGGKYANNVAQLASMANTLGIKVDPRLGDKEAAESLAIEMASNFRQPGTGPMTDKDFENFMKRVPDLSKTAPGRKEITKTMREFIKDDIETAKLAREYAKKNRGLLDEDFFSQVGELRAKRGFGNFDQSLSQDEQNELAALRARFGK